MGMTFYLHGLSPKNQLPQLMARKTTDKSQLRSILQNTWPGLFDIEVIRNKESLKNAQPRRAWGDTSKQNAGFILDGILEEEKNIW